MFSRSTRLLRRRSCVKRAALDRYTRWMSSAASCWMRVRSCRSKLRLIASFFAIVSSVAICAAESTP